MKIENLGVLRARVVGGEDGDGAGLGPSVVMLHGFGAPGDDLVSIARAVAAPKGTRWYFLEAPIDLGPQYMGGRAWWNIDMMETQDMMRRGDFRGLVERTPKGLDSAMDLVVGALRSLYELTTKIGASSKVVLGGFSQGAMLSSHLAARFANLPLAGVVLMSGSLIGASELRPRFGDLVRMPILMSHGKEDPVLPFVIAEQFQTELVAAGARVTWIPFRGGHGIGPEVISGLGAFLQSALS